MHGEDISYSYGFWSLVIVNVGLFDFFLMTVTKIWTQKRVTDEQ